MKVWEGWVCWVQLANMWQHCSLTAVQRKTAFVEESWWPEFNLFGSMPWCSFPWHKLLPMLAPKNCHTTVWIWSRSSHPRFRRRLRVIVAGLPEKAFPQKLEKVDTGHQRFSVVAQAKGYFQLKELHRTTKDIAQMNSDWKVEKAQYAEFNVPTCGKIASCQLCRERQPVWNSHDGLNLTCLDQCHGVRSHGTSSSQCCAKELSYNSLNLIHEFTSLFSPKVIVAGLPRKAFPRTQAFVDISVFLSLATPQDSPKASPMAIFKWKNLIGQLNPLLEWMLHESLRRLSLLSSMCQHVARLQVVSCAEKDSLCGTVMMAWI